MFRCFDDQRSLFFTSSSDVSCLMLYVCNFFICRRLVMSCVMFLILDVLMLGVYCVCDFFVSRYVTPMLMCCDM